MVILWKRLAGEMAGVWIRGSHWRRFYLVDER